MLNRNSRVEQIITSVFISLEFALGILVQITHGAWNTAVSFGAVLCCFLYSLLWMRRGFPAHILTAGLLFTVLADLFLVVLRPQLQLPAMACFSVVQLMYFWHIYREQNDRRGRIVHIALRIVAGVAILPITAAVLGKAVDALSLLSVFYYVNLLCNIIFSFTMPKRALLLSLGLILFACCDLFVGFSVLAEGYLPLMPGTLWYALAHPGFNIAWLFYVPSQAFLALYSRQIAFADQISSPPAYHKPK